MRRAPEPAGEERAGGPGVPVLPERAEALLEGPGATDLEVLAVQSPEGRPLLIGKILWSPQPQVLGAREPLIPRPLERAVFAATDMIDGLVQVNRPGFSGELIT